MWLETLANRRRRFNIWAKIRGIIAVGKLLESKFEPAVKVLLKTDIVQYTAELTLYRYSSTYKDSWAENYSAYSTSLRLRLKSQRLMSLS